MAPNCLDGERPAWQLSAVYCHTFCEVSGQFVTRNRHRLRVRHNSRFHSQRIVVNPRQKPAAQVWPSGRTVGETGSIFQADARVKPWLRHQVDAAGSLHSVPKCRHISSRTPPIDGLWKTFDATDDFGVTEGFGRGDSLGCVCGSSCRCPESDLLVCPSVPPWLPP